MPEIEPALPIEWSSDEGEWQRLEWKRSLSERDAIGESLSALANTSGGEVKIGIDNAGREPGIAIGHDTIESLTNDLYQHLDPVPILSITWRPVGEGRYVVTVSVQESPLKPVRFGTVSFRRVGRSNRRLSMEEEYQLYSTTRGRSWDSVSSGQPVSEISREKLLSYGQRVGARSPERAAAMRESMSWLNTVGFSDGDTLTFAGVLCLTNNPNEVLPSAEVHCAVFESDDPVHFADRRVISGTVFEQIEAALDFVRQHVSSEIRVPAGRAVREERASLSLVAAREALANAVCHRDYGSTSHIQVRIHPSRLEIWNPGTLLPPLQISDLFKDHESKPRNPRLAQALFQAGYVEQFGTGTLRMVEDCVRLGLPQPLFEESDGRFRVSLVKRALHERFFVEELNARQRELVRLMSSDKRTITVDSYQSLFGISRLTAWHDLKNLLERGIVGRTRMGHRYVYVLTVR